MLNFHPKAHGAQKDLVKQNAYDNRRNNIGQVNHGLEEIGSSNKPPGKYVGKEKTKGNLAEDRNKHYKEVIPERPIEIGIGKNICIRTEAHKINIRITAENLAA
jgi:hypothetical protein